MKKTLSILLAVCLLLTANLTMPLSAISATVDPTSTGDSYGDIEYYVMNGKAVIYSLSDYYISSVTIPSEIEGHSVTAIAGNAFSEYTNLSSVSIPGSVRIIKDGAFCYCTALKSLVIPEGVYVIGNNVFSYCNGLKSITLPASVKSIGPNSFDDCEDLTISGYTGTYAEEYANEHGIKFNSLGEAPAASEVETLSGTTGDCTWTLVGSELTISSSGAMDDYNSWGDGAPWGDYITSVVIEDGVTYIGDYAFYECIGLNSVDIPDSVTGIGEGAFSDCSALADISIPDGIEYIGDFAFGYTKWYNDQPEGILYLGNCAYAFKGDCPSEVIIKEGTKGISAGIFSSQSSLTSVTIPDSVTRIGYGAFEYCDNLESVNIPEGVTSIEGNTFNGCGKLTEIVIPDGVTSIGRDAFSYCTQLSSITIPDSVVSIGNRAFFKTAWYSDQPKGLVYAGKVLYRCKGTCPAEVTVQDGTLGIADCAFYLNINGEYDDIAYSQGTKELVSITLPDGLLVIGSEAFEGCTNLESVNIPDGVNSIGGYAFAGCRSLTSITVPDSVERIYGCAFMNCSELMSVTIAAGVKDIGQFAFGFTEEYYDDYYCEAITGFTVCGFSGSAAERYATLNGFDFVALGAVPTEYSTTAPTTAPSEAPSETPSTAPTTAPTVAPTEHAGIKLLGDVDDSGKVNIFDAAFVQKAITGTSGYPDFKNMDKSDAGFISADVDSNGTVNIFDAALILKFTTGDSSVAKYGIGEALK